VHALTRSSIDSHQRIGSRGFHGDIIFVDEFSFVPEEVLQTNALVNMVVDFRTVFVMSSPINAESMRMQLLLKTRTIPGMRPGKDNRTIEEKLWSILDLSVVCADCTARQNDMCAHKLENRSAWKSIKQENVLRILMSARYFRTEVRLSISLPFPVQVRVSHSIWRLGW
jgi:hypothetical protein